MMIGIILLGRNLGAIITGLPRQLFLQSTVVLLSSCKEGEGKGQGDAHEKGVTTSPTSASCSAQPAAAGKNLPVGDSATNEQSPYVAHA